MRSRFQTAVALFLAGLILFILVSPLLDLPSTTLQARQNGFRVSLQVALLQFAALILLVFHALNRAWRQEATLLPAESVLELNCIRRC